MSIYELAMQDREFKRKILIEFAFGQHNQREVEKWLKKNYSYKVAEWRKQKTQGNVVQLYSEGMTMQERDALLDKEEKIKEMFKEW